MRRIMLSALAAIGIAAPLGAQPVSVPNSFTSNTAISASAMNANFAALVAAVGNNLVPIGTVIASTLTQAQMDAQCGAGLWLLANGSAAPAAYATATGQANLPDLRGVFLRGKNNGRNDGKQDPMGDNALGTYEGDQMQDHMHNWLNDGTASGLGIPAPSVYAPAGGGWFGFTSLTWSGVTNFPPHVGNVTTVNGDWSNGAGMSLFAARVGTETRPKSLVVNYFIKVK